MILPTTFCGKVTGVCGFALLLTMAVTKDMLDIPIWSL